MKRKTFGAISAAFALSAVLAPGANAVDDPPQGIVGGTTASSNPGAIYLITDYGNGTGSTCTASLIDSNSVLTARHCVDGGKNVTVRIGSLNSGSGGTVHAGTRYDYPGGADLAVVTLATSSSAKPVTLATSRPAAGSTNSIYGWGRTVCAKSGAGSPTLKTANVRVNGTTTDAYGGVAIASTGINGGAWSGDSGGPQFNGSGQQVGVASTANCGYYVQNYTSVADYRTWILNTAAKY